MTKTLQTLVVAFLLLTAMTLEAQVTVGITQLKVNGVSTSIAGPIDFGTSTTKSVSCKIVVEKPANFTIGVCTVYLRARTGFGSNYIEYGDFVLNAGFTTQAYTEQINFTAHSSDFNFGGGHLYAAVVQNQQPGTVWESPHTPIIKTPTYSVTSSPSSYVCGSTSPIVFTANSAAVGSSYQWNIGSGWLKGGVPTPTTAFSNSITLVPNGYPQGPITLTPTFNGAVQSTQNVNIPIAPLNTLTTILGAERLCPGASSTFSLSNLDVGTTTTWSVSSTFATITTYNNSEATLSIASPLLMGRSINLVATISNICGQQKAVTKTFWAGPGALPVLISPSGVPYMATDVPMNCSTPEYLFKSSDIAEGAIEFRFVSNGQTVYKYANNYGYAVLAASDFGMAVGQTRTVDVSVRNACGWSGKPRRFSIYRPTPCQCGIGAGCTLPRLAPPSFSNPKEFAVFPNPAINSITVTFYNEKSNVAPFKGEILDMKGQAVKSFTGNNNEAIINTQDLPKGIYILRVDGSNDRQRVVIQ